VCARVELLLLLLASGVQMKKRCLGFFSFSKTLKVLWFPFSNPKPSASVSSSSSSSSLTSRAQKRLSSSAAESHYSQNARKHRLKKNEIISFV